VATTNSLNKKAAILLTLLVVFCFVPTAQAQTGTLVTVHFIDVGQGDSIFIDTANKDVLIDAGSASASQTVLDYLADLNITHLHYVVATHAHEDHIGGLVDVLDSTVTIDTVIVNNQTHSSSTYSNFITNAQGYNVTVAERGNIITLTETATLTILNPVQPIEFSDLNDNSIVTKLQVGNTTFMFTGDAEEPAEQSMLVSSVCSLKSDLLKVGHHGSYTATSQTFLDIVDPTYAVISAGLDNRYGHPHNETLVKLDAAGVTTFCTINSSTIVVQTDGTTITFLDDPTPIIIPELPVNLLLPVFIAATLIGTMLYRKKLRIT